MSVREVMGLSSPFYFRAASAIHLVAFHQLKQDAGFKATWGIRTTERRHPCYNFSTACVTSWHGAVWPFE